MSNIVQAAQARLAISSRTLREQALRVEAQSCRDKAKQLSSEELKSEAVRAGACLAVALDKLSAAVRELRYADAESELQRALSFSAWMSACQESSSQNRHAQAA